MLEDWQKKVVGEENGKGKERQVNSVLEIGCEEISLQQEDTVRTVLQLKKGVPVGGEERIKKVDLDLQKIKRVLGISRRYVAE